MIVISGASGYVGSHITRRLVETGQPVRAFVHNLSHAKGEGRLAGLNIDWMEGDVTNPSSLVQSQITRSAAFASVTYSWCCTWA